jgi:type VI secretion system secreted protein VgrG
LDAKGQANAAALSGIKTKEFGGTGYNQLVFDDTDNQLRVQLATTQHASQLNLGHLIHQADNHRGGLRGQGFELRTDAYGAIRGRQGVLLSTYGQLLSEPAGDNAAALALQGQLWTLSKVMSELAKTHETVELSATLGSFYAGGSVTLEAQPPLQAMLTVLKGMVSAVDLEQAQADAAEHNTATNDKLPHSSEPIVAIAAKAGLVQVAGQHIEAAAGETLSLAAGQDIQQATGGAFRIHTGQAIGMLAGAVKPGDQAAGKGITLIAGEGNIDVQALTDAIQVAAKHDVKIQSQLAHIDWAAAKKIVIICVYYLRQTRFGCSAANILRLREKRTVDAATAAENEVETN